MEIQTEIDDLAFSPSFNCYFSDSLTSTTTTTTAIAAAKVSRELIQEKSAQFHEFIDVDEDDFEFSLVLNEEEEDEEVLGKQISVHQRLPVGEIDTVSSSVHIQIQKLFVNGGETSSFSSSSSSSSSSSELEESDVRPSGSFCMWRPKSYDVVSSTLTKCKIKNSSSSSSAGSGSGSGSGFGSRRWRRILDLLRRSNSAGQSRRKIEIAKQNRKVSPVEVAAGKLKAGGSTTSFHELFYAQKRAEKEGDKMKSFLPYRQDLLGFFVNIHRIGNKK